MSKKDKKTIAILFTVFFLLTFFAGGEDNSWLEIFSGSMLLGSLYTAISFVIYKLVSLFFNLNQLIDKEEAMIVTEEIVKKNETGIDS